ncbi:hypothetical protein [Staphylococcus delphini]|uniref:Uncharacterized protein n=1 Tax=Staphylococcus delphini TaxID=53344 RepID=A0AAX0QQ93_9STAP|nr:hypothetical protein [Staphylococcus delphini]NBK48296.1 hypothetical protein [Staphylococcus delphini]PCF45447.1 hypothetical protein B5C07_13035 [Staphylococcus delphini]PNZ87441.1 hypothetical protein CD148_13475 [Staphylococcus delphini]RIZ48746.1 hypothetical protein CDL68_12770 [Staphylococcus delphini]VED63153.1 Uncharacterised protein [Staphylococcus delphini]
MEDIESKLQAILHDGEKILLLSRKNSKGSIYVLFRRGSAAYMPIRISNHRNHTYFSNETFYTKQGEDVMLA